MKIAFLNIYNGVINRGGETFVKELAAGLSNNHEVYVFQSGDPTGRERYKVIKIPVAWDWKQKSAEETLIARFFLDYWNRQIFLFTLKIIPQLFKYKFDIVLPVNGGWMPLILRLATWFSGSKLVITGQSGIGWDDGVNILCFPDVFVGLSSKAANWAKKINPFVKSVYIPNGVDLNKFKSKSGMKDLTTYTKTILAVGAFTVQKRLDLAIKAVAKLKKVKLLIAGGGGDLKPQLIRLGNTLLGEKRFNIISVNHDDMPQVYNKADVFTLPSGAPESFGIVFVEAMASNLPVVAADDQIRREIVGDAGILVDPTNSDEYTNALKTALEIDWGNKPRKQAEKFGWDKIAKEYEKLFRSL